MVFSLRTKGAQFFGSRYTIGFKVNCEIGKSTKNYQLPAKYKFFLGFNLLCQVIG